MADVVNRFESVQHVRDGLKAVDYLADDGIAGVAFLADRLGKPILVEGPAGTGKTQLAKSIAEMTDSRLIRLQCYEGLDESKALYEWNYKKQLLRIQADRNSDSWSEIHDDIFSDEFLLTRPLLEAITAPDSKAFNLGVQWHPEWQAASDPVSRRLLESFGAACRTRRMAKEDAGRNS